MGESTCLLFLPDICRLLQIHMQCSVILFFFLLQYAVFVHPKIMISYYILHQKHKGVGMVDGDGVQVGVGRGLLIPFFVMALIRTNCLAKVWDIFLFCCLLDLLIYVLYLMLTLVAAAFYHRHWKWYTTFRKVH